MEIVYSDSWIVKFWLIMSSDWFTTTHSSSTPRWVRGVDRHLAVSGGYSTTGGQRCPTAVT